MPYFQRAPVDVAIPASVTPSAETPAKTIVERASAILGKSAATTAPAQPAVPLVPGLSTDVSPALTPPTPTSPLGGSAPAARANELIGSFLNLLSHSGRIAQLAPSSPAALPSSARGVPSTVPLIEVTDAAKAGSRITIRVPAANDGINPAALLFYNTDFISDSGHAIPSECATFSPRTLMLPGCAKGASEMTVEVPAQSAGGAYSALVQATGLVGPCAVVVVRVE